MNCTDRDLLVFEPHLFRDIAWSGQQLVRGSGVITESTLIFTDADLGPAAAGLAAGHVAVHAGTSLEVLGRVSDLEYTVSRVRSDPADPVLQPANAPDAPVLVATFAPQIRAAHDRVMRLVGIEPAGPLIPGQPEESQITNAQALRPLVALAALEIIFRAAGSLLDESHPILQRARMYAGLFEAHRERTVVHIDSNGDGIPDCVRRLNGSPLARQ